MAFSFPDPSLTPEFTGANGITYTWDATDEKWVVKGFSTEEDPRYVKRQGGDSMEGPLVMEGPRNAGDDPLLPDKVSSIKTLNVDNTQNSGLQLRHNGNAKVYVGDSDVSFAADIKFNRNAPTVIKNNTQDLLSFDGNEVAYLGEIIEDEDIVNKRFVEDITDQLHQEIIELEEEIEAILPSVERGVWTMNLLGTVAQKGQMSLYDDDYTNVGSPTGLFKNAKSIWLNELDNDGTPHGFENVEAGELIELFVQGAPEYGLYEVVDTHDETNGAAQWWVIEVNFVRTLEDTSTADNGDLIRIKIFQPPEGGTADGFVLKTGDTMSGFLQIGDTDLMPDGQNTDSPKLYFANKNTSNTKKSPYLYSKYNTTTIYSSSAIRSGGTLSAHGNLQYDGSTRVGLHSTGGYLGYGTSESSRPLEWNSSGIFKLWGYNGQGESGQVLKLDNSLRPYWGAASSADKYVKTNTTGFNNSLTITKTGNTYYITGG